MQWPSAAKLRENRLAASGLLVGCLILPLLLFVGFCGYVSNVASNVPPHPDIEAYVNFDGEQFTVRNQNTEPWQSVELELNGGVLGGGYKATHGRVPSGSAFTVGALQFAKSDDQSHEDVCVRTSRQQAKQVYRLLHMGLGTPALA